MPKYLCNNTSLGYTGFPTSHISLSKEPVWLFIQHNQQETKTSTFVLDDNIWYISTLLCHFSNKGHVKVEVYTVFLYFHIYLWLNKGYFTLRKKIAIYYETLTHWGRVTHICVGKLTIIGWDNILSPARRQAIIWTNAGIMLIGPLGTNFSEILSEIHTFSFKKMHLKMSSGKCRPFCLGLNVLKMFSPMFMEYIPFFLHVSELI